MVHKAVCPYIAMFSSDVIAIVINRLYSLVSNHLLIVNHPTKNVDLSVRAITRTGYKISCNLIGSHMNKTLP